MSVCYCLTDALRIGRLPERQWRDEIQKLPTECGKSDCTAGGCCQTTVRTFLEGQRACRIALERMKARSQAAAARAGGDGHRRRRG